MIDYLAISILPTSSRTRIHALAPQAGFCLRTVGINGTLRPAAFIRIAYVLRNADASTCTVSLFANCIRSTRGRVAGVQCLLLSDRLQTLAEWVSLKARDANAVGSVAHHSALGVLSTHPWAGVLAFSVHARQMIGAFATAHALRSTVGRSPNKLGKTRA